MDKKPESHDKSKVSQSMDKKAESHDKSKVSQSMDKKAESHDKSNVSQSMDKKIFSLKILAAAFASAFIFFFSDLIFLIVVNFNGLLVTDLNFFFITNLSPTVFALSISVLI
jgi:hypothetical protein